MNLRDFLIFMAGSHATWLLIQVLREKWWLMAWNALFIAVALLGVSVLGRFDKQEDE